ncbi:MAG: hypothetical protein MUC49_14485 [Raineya sp.]|jgi:hypothetical protein|nr:hypothetical protein [Raineya sp.]
MKPLVISSNTPRHIDIDFNIDWLNLISSGMTIDKEDDIEYLSEIKKYCNNGGIPNGIIGKMFNYRQDSDFERLLSIIHYLPLLQEHFIEYLFTKTAIQKHLTEFYSTPSDLPKQLLEAKFEYLNSFKIEGELSNYLYYYGMYDYFYQHNSTNKAMEVSKRFTKLLYQSDLENIVCFSTTLAWGNWFDQHSCTDRSFVFINHVERIIWLFCFSHSD